MSVDESDLMRFGQPHSAAPALQGFHQGSNYMLSRPSSAHPTHGGFLDPSTSMSYQPPSPPHLYHPSTPPHFDVDSDVPIKLEQQPQSQPQQQHHQQPFPLPLGLPPSSSSDIPDHIAGNTQGTGTQVPLAPSFFGFIETTSDALMIIEALLQGHLSHVPRRPQDRERPELVRSGNVFIYEENASGIKRWTDGIHWSPSRILGNFLIYRELTKPFPAGEKKRALKKPKKSGVTAETGGVTKRSSSQSPPSLTSTLAQRVGGSVADLKRASPSSESGINGMSKEEERSLVGSLVGSYDFKPGGLVKKTISVSYQGILHHIVSYYSLEDVMGPNRKLLTPSQRKAFALNFAPRADLWTESNFRAGIESEGGRLQEMGLVGPPPTVHPTQFVPGGYHIHHQEQTPFPSVQYQPTAPTPMYTTPVTNEWQQGGPHMGGDDTYEPNYHFASQNMASELPFRQGNDQLVPLSHMTPHITYPMDTQSPSFYSSHVGRGP